MRISTFKLSAEPLSDNTMSSKCGYLCFANWTVWWLDGGNWDHWYYMGCDNNQCVITANILQAYIYNVNRLTSLQSKPNAFLYNFSLAIYLSPKASFIVWVMYVIWLRPSKMRLRRSWLWDISVLAFEAKIIRVCNKILLLSTYMLTVEPVCSFPCAGGWTLLATPDNLLSDDLSYRKCMWLLVFLGTTMFKQLLEDALKNRFSLNLMNVLLPLRYIFLCSLLMIQKHFSGSSRFRLSL